MAGATLSLVDVRVARLCPDLFLGSLTNLWIAAGPGAEKKSERSKFALTRTDPEGRFELPNSGDAAIGIILVTADGHPPHLEVIDAGKPLNVRLEEGRDVAVQVLSGEDDKPVEGADATLVPLYLCGPVIGAFGEDLVQRAKGDAEGRIVFHQVPDGAYGLRLVGKGCGASSAAPMLVRKGSTEYRIQVPPGMALKGKVEVPARATHSAGKVFAFWKDETGPGWAEATISAGDGSFEVNGIPFPSQTWFLARTEDGLSSRLLSLKDLGQSREGLKNPMPLKSPEIWRGRLEEGLKVSRLIVHPVLSDELPAEEMPGPIAVPVTKDGTFDIPEVPPAAEALRLVAPGYGEAEVRLDPGASSDLGLVKIRKSQVVAGRVLWEDRSPLVAGELEILSASSLLCRTKLTRQGEFACALLSPPAGNLRYQVRQANAIFHATPADAKDMTLIAAAGNPFLITVSRPDGRVRVQDVQVELQAARFNKPTGSPGEKIVRFGHSEGGTFALHVDAAVSTGLWVSGFAGTPRTTIPLNAPKKSEVQGVSVSLAAGPVLYGTVSAAGTSRPIEGAEVAVAPGQTEKWRRVLVTRVDHTDGAGAWRLEEVGEAAYRLIASARGYAPKVEGISVPKDTERPHDFQLERPGGVHGKVLGIRKGSTTMVRLTPWRWWMNSAGYTGNPDQAGEFTIEPVPPNRYRLSIETSREGPDTDGPSDMEMQVTSVEVKRGEISEVEIDLSKGIDLAGRVFLHGKPAANSHLELRRLSPRKKVFRSSNTNLLKTDGKGGYRATLPRPGSYQVSLYTREGKKVLCIRMDPPMEVGEGTPQRKDLNFSTGRLRGRFVDEAEKPVPEVSVTIQQILNRSGDEEAETSGYGNEYARSGEDGRFDADPLGKGEYRILASAPGYAGVVLEALSVGPDQEVDLQDIVLRRGDSVRVVALDPNGNPLRDAQVFARKGPSFDSFDLMRGGMSMDKTGEDGTAALEALLPGTYSLVGLSASFAPAFLEGVKVPFEEKASPVPLRFVIGGTLQVRVVRKTGVPVPDLYPQITDDQGRNLTDLYGYLSTFSADRFITDGDGRASLDGVLPGEYLVSAGAGPKADGRKVSITAGQTSSVVLTIDEEESD